MRIRSAGAACTIGVMGWLLGACSMDGKAWSTGEGVESANADVTFWDEDDRAVYTYYSEPRADLGVAYSHGGELSLAEPADVYSDDSKPRRSGLQKGAAEPADTGDEADYIQIPACCKTKCPYGSCWVPMGSTSCDCFCNEEGQPVCSGVGVSD